MKTNQKKLTVDRSDYQSPECSTILLSMQGILCASGFNGTIGSLHEETFQGIDSWN